MPRLTAIDPNTAHGSAKDLLGAVQQKIGMAPNVLRTMAHSPAALKGYLDFGEALSTGRFDPETREAIALAVAGANTCIYCASAHTAVSKSLKVDAAEIRQRLTGRASDPKLDAVLVFARSVVDKRGWVSDEDIAAVHKAGHDDQTVVEIVANVVANIFTNYLNHIADTDVDFPVVEMTDRKAA